MTAPLDALVVFLRSCGERSVGVHPLGVPECEPLVEACERAGVRAVPITSHPAVVVTLDALAVGGTVRCAKDEVDAAVPDARRVIVVRHLGDVPLAPTMDAYLDVQMVPGRDVWLDEL